MPAVDRNERIDRLHHAGAGRPPAADARGQRHDGHFAPRDAASPAFDRRARERPAGHDQLGIVDVADVEIDRQPVPRQPDSPALQIIAKLSRAEPRQSRFRGESAPPRRPTATSSRSSLPRVTGKRWLIIVRKTRKQLARFGAAIGEMIDVGTAVVRQRRQLPAIIRGVWSA